eukprot:1966192-Amphidinium_carterae.1
MAEVQTSAEGETPSLQLLPRLVQTVSRWRFAADNASRGTTGLVLAPATGPALQAERTNAKNACRRVTDWPSVLSSGIAPSRQFDSRAGAATATQQHSPVKAHEGPAAQAALTSLGASASLRAYRRARKFHFVHHYA